MKNIYRKYQNIIENMIFPLVLLLYPLCKLNQGIDVSDTAYSLSNFEYFGQMNGTWIVATFLANAAGSLLMHLPFADTLLGINFYTALVQSTIALTAYFVLRKRIPAPLMAAGEFVALGLCWCPSVILYNYLTYLLMTAGILLLYAGILEEPEKSEKAEKRKKIYYVTAGICLGANVAVRMPNVVQAAFILAVWYDVWTGARGGKLSGKCRGSERPLLRALRDTGWCVLGYLIGFGVPFAVICIRYGLQAYPAMVQTMFAMTEKASDYKPSSMLTGMLDDYGRGLYWLSFAGVCVAAGWLMFGAAGRIWEKLEAAEGDGAGQRRGFSGSGRALWGLCRICYAGLFLVLLRFYWGRGMFTFRYYEHDCRSMYYPTVLLLLAALAAAVYCLACRRVRREQKVFAVLIILEVFATPLGSNNDLYPIINNLFLVVPFWLWVVYDIASEKAERRSVCGEDAGGLVWKTPVVVLLLFVLIQSVGFHMNFVFQDGIWGEKRDTLIETPVKAAGVYTNRENGEMLEELALYVQDAGFSGREVLLYGDIPGLGYLLDLQSALTTFWPDLDSYRMAEFERDMDAIVSRMEAGQESPLIILDVSAAAYLSGDAAAMDWFGADRERMDEDEKLRQLGMFMEEYGYAEQFANARYAVYESE